MKFLHCLLLLLLVPNVDAAPNDIPPTLNLSSPEKTLASYWAVKDWHEKAILAEALAEKNTAHSVFMKEMEELTEGETKKYFSNFQPGPLTILSRKVISKVEESAFRVIIVANVKNVTPIPAGVSPAASDVARREAGQDFKYILEKKNDEWRILEIWALHTPGIKIPGLPNIPSLMFQKYKELPTPYYPSAVYDD